ncbi:MAG: DUF554 domain-containing protein [Oscillospiraceae bacterium]|nr:DUF554 domain-containing protein [Oscillospiraceae bacterium]
MIGTGTIANVAAVILGGLIGLLLKKGLSKRFEDTLMQAIGIAVVFIGAAGAMPGMLEVAGNSLSGKSSLSMILSLALGALVGEALNIENALERFGTWLKHKVEKDNESPFVEGFVNTSLVICVGAMAVVGALQDGLGNGADMLYSKALLDGVIVLVFASTYGKGAIFSALPIALWQGGITLAASLLAPFVSEPVLDNLSFIGSILIFCVGINLCFGKRIRVGNMLPALVFGVIITVLF